jgi:hypothetical protein
MVSLCSTKRFSNSLTSVTGLFQSDHDFDIVSELSYDAGLTQMEEEAQAAAKAAGKDDKETNGIYYSIYGPSCSSSELVRKHLDSGALVYLIAEKEAALLAMPSKEQELEHYFRDPCYVYVLLGACAMTLGCQIPDQYISMLKKVYTEGGLMPDALRQMKKALKGPHGYKNGEPYNFESKDLVETANAMDDKDEDSNKLGFIGMNVLSPGGLFDTGMRNSSTSAIIKELRKMQKYPDVCAGCGADAGPGGKTLLMCARCKDRKYCSVECQKQHWSIYRKLCEPTMKRG